MPAARPLLAIVLALTACDPVPTAPEELTAEQEDLRAQGAAAYDHVGWTYQHRANGTLVLQLLQRHSDPDQVLQRLPIEPGMTVADIGCGVGWFTFRLADLVGPEGRVHALDIQPRAVGVVEARASDPAVNPHANVSPRLSDVDDCGLAHDSVDVVFLAHLGFYLHAELLDENVRWMESLVRALGSDGQLVVLEYVPPGFTNQHLVPHFERVGFTLASSEHYERHQTWLYVFDSPRLTRDRADTAADSEASG